MPKVTKTELNQQTARVLARVAAGERLVVTDRGRPVAEISPPTVSRWDELVAAGRIAVPTRSGGLATPAERTHRPSSEILDELRSERL